jgi:hypothetical protein
MSTSFRWLPLAAVCFLFTTQALPAQKREQEKPVVEDHHVRDGTAVVSAGRERLRLG